MASLCERCEGIFSEARLALGNPVVAERNSWEFGGFQALQRNAEKSQCRLCCIIFSLKRQNAVDQVIQDGHQHKLKYTFRFVDEDRTILSLYISPVEQINPPLFSSCVRFRRSESENSGEPAAETSTWSWQSVRLVQDWLTQCSSSHEACSPISPAKRLPLRLLDVDIADEIPRLRSQSDEIHIDSLSLENMPHVKLCSSAGLASNTQYLTLSHCWGQSPGAKLSNQNLAQYYQSIPPHDLVVSSAATFRQAIHVARCLNFRYLWVDALCINQDDKDEKEKEITYMNEIYAHATLNLSATAAQDGSSGLYFERDPRVVGTCRSERHRGIVAFAPPEHSFVHEVLRGPIGRRAWVFQERMLATRVLHFCRTRLFWECCTLQETESLSDDIPRSLVVPPGQTKQLVLPRQRRGCLTADKARLRWANILNSYSRTSLTYQKDTLLALSAIATTLCEQRGLEPRDYMAGLWFPDLPLALRWRVSRQPDRIPTQYVSPSWSWASLFCDVDIQRDSYVRVFVDDFVPSICLKTTSAPFGSITDGSLRLRGTLRPLCYLESEDCFRIGASDSYAPTVISSGFPGTIRNGLPYKVYKWSKRGQISKFVEELTESHDPPLEESDVLICEWDHGIPGHDRTPKLIHFVLPNGRFHEVQDGSFFLLPLGQRKRSEEEDEEGEEETEADDRRGSFDRIEGLILHRTSEKGEYVRVGIFYYTLQDSIHNEEEILGSISGKDEWVDDDSYLQRHGDSGRVTYTIQIV